MMPRPMCSTISSASTTRDADTLTLGYLNPVDYEEQAKLAYDLPRPLQLSLALGRPAIDKP